MDINQLTTNWVGKFVRTERPLTEDEFLEWVGPFHRDWYPGYVFGGEGIVEGFFMKNDLIWVRTDQGRWVIDDQTEIVMVDRDRNRSE